MFSDNRYKRKCLVFIEIKNRTHFSQSNRKHVKLETLEALFFHQNTEHLMQRGLKKTEPHLFWSTKGFIFSPSLFNSEIGEQNNIFTIFLYTIEVLLSRDKSFERWWINQLNFSKVRLEWVNSNSFLNSNHFCSN